MTDVNHRRANRPPVDRRHPASHYHNGYPRTDRDITYADGEVFPRQERQHRVGGTGYLDKSMHGWGGKGGVSGVRVGASIGNDFANGHRGMARSVRGAKKFVRTRLRFHENGATRRLVDETAIEEADLADDLEMFDDFQGIKAGLEAEDAAAR